jgi:hypothetical protein
MRNTPTPGGNQHWNPHIYWNYFAIVSHLSDQRKHPEQIFEFFKVWEPGLGAATFYGDVEENFCPADQSDPVRRDELVLQPGFTSNAVRR